MGTFDRLIKKPANDLSIDRAMGNARYCLNSPEGRALIEHLVEVFGVDQQVGFASGEEAIYINGKQDGLKYILALLIEDEKGDQNE